MVQRQDQRDIARFTIRRSSVGDPIRPPLYRAKRPGVPVAQNATLPSAPRPADGAGILNKFEQYRRTVELTDIGLLDQ